MEENNLDGKVSMGYQGLGEYYWHNITDPIESIEDIHPMNVSYLLLYNYIVWRDQFPAMDRYAQGDNCNLIYTVEHEGVEVIWLYEVNEPGIQR